jgi:hypothetical protein
VERHTELDKHLHNLHEIWCLRVNQFVNCVALTASLAAWYTWQFFEVLEPRRDLGFLLSSEICVVLSASGRTIAM